jgi:hypothetical protein
MCSRTEVLRARFFDWQQRQQAATSLQSSADEVMRTLRATAQAAGMASALDALLAPPAPPPPSEPMVRILAVKPYKIAHRGRHGVEVYSGGPNSINDIPAACLKALDGRVEVVPAATELHGVGVWNPGC